jgi:sulfite exporter TauE/SafE
MHSYTILGNILFIQGLKLSNEKPVVAAYVQLVNEATNIAYGSTTTNEDGYWSFTFDTPLPSGRYIIKFIGSGMKQYVETQGDWERIDIMGNDLLS